MTKANSPATPRSVHRTTAENHRRPSVTAGVSHIAVKGTHRESEKVWRAQTYRAMALSLIRKDAVGSGAPSGRRNGNYRHGGHKRGHRAQEPRDITVADCA